MTILKSLSTYCYDVGWKVTPAFTYFCHASSNLRATTFDKLEHKWYLGARNIKKERSRVSFLISPLLHGGERAGITKRVEGGKPGIATAKRPMISKSRYRRRNQRGSQCVHANRYANHSTGPVPFGTTCVSKASFVHPHSLQGKKQNLSHKNTALQTTISHLSESCEETCYLFMLFRFSKIFCCLSILLEKND